MNFYEKPEISDDLIGMAEILILGAVVASSVDDAYAHVSGGYTVKELEDFCESTDLRRLTTAWVTSAVERNWDDFAILNKSPNEIWQNLMYTLGNGAVAIGRKLRRNMLVDDIISEFKGR